jgi:hypothetical protein
MGWDMARRVSRLAGLLVVLAMLAGVAAAQHGTIFEAIYTVEGMSVSGPTDVPAGMTSITFAYHDERDDLLALISLSGGRTLDEFFVTMEQLFSGELSVTPPWIHFHGGLFVGADGTHSYTTFLSPGTYYLLSIEGDEEGPFAARGLLLPIEVSAPSLDHDVVITLLDYEFSIEGTLTAGTQMVQVHNGANQPHEVIFIPLPPGVTLDDFFAPPAEGAEGDEEPPMGTVHGMWAMDPGVTTVFALTLEPGTYAVVCFIPDADGPHFMQGMAMEVTVR